MRRRRFGIFHAFECERHIMGSGSASVMPANIAANAEYGTRIAGKTPRLRELRHIGQIGVEFDQPQEERGVDKLTRPAFGVHQ
jgi:hypothetical protein